MKQCKEKEKGFHKMGKPFPLPRKNLFYEKFGFHETVKLFVLSQAGMNLFYNKWLSQDVKTILLTTIFTSHNEAILLKKWFLVDRKIISTSQNKNNLLKNGLY